MRIEGEPTNKGLGFVQGVWYRAVMMNTVFDFWTIRPLKKSELYPVALRYANRGGAGYEMEDVVSVRKKK